jgi:uncharacterized repeat protein (TIGR02543 family)
MKRFLVALLLILGSTSLLAQHEWITSVTASVTGSRVESFAYSAYVDQYGNDAWGWINGSHCGLGYCDNFEVFHAQYSGYWNLVAEAGCYNVYIDSTFAPLNPWGSAAYDRKGVTVCRSPPPIRYYLAIWINVDGNVTPGSGNGYHDAGSTVTISTSGPPDYQFSGWTGDVTSPDLTTSVYIDRDKTVTANWTSSPSSPPDHDPNNIVDNSGCPQFQNCNSPIIINLGNGPYQLSGRNEPVRFDIDANGTLDRIGWTAAGAPMAFLALDRNGNGTIDSGSELFGNHTPVPGGVAANGFDALAQYDANGDGVIDASDPIWPSLLRWTDLNHDGISQPSELALLSASAVTAISLDYHWTGRRDQSGNIFRYQSKVWIDSTGKHATPRPVYDVYFIPAP